jgi:hypothetical protein
MTGGAASPATAAAALPAVSFKALRRDTEYVVAMGFSSRLTISASYLASVLRACDGIVARWDAFRFFPAGKE